MMLTSTRRIILGSALALGLVGSGLGDGIHRIQGSPRDEAGLSVRLTAAGNPFTVRGGVRGLFPGTRRRLRLTVVNPTPFALRVTSIRVLVGNAAPGCGFSTLASSNFRGSLKVPARGAKSLRLPIRMRTGAPDACQGARYPLTFTGKAVRA